MCKMCHEGVSDTEMEAKNEHIKKKAKEHATKRG